VPQAAPTIAAAIYPQVIALTWLLVSPTGKAPLHRRYGRPAPSVLCDSRPTGTPEIAEEERPGVTPWRASYVTEFCPRKNGGGRPRERNH